MTLQQRGRQSTESKIVVQISPTRNLPEPPLGLSKAATALWVDITESLPDDFFRAGDLPLLQSYCISSDRKNLLDAAILKDGMTHNGDINPALRVSRDEATLMASLAVKLRLCQSSRTRPESASLNVVHSGKRPWDLPD